MPKKFLNGIQITTGSPAAGKVWTASDTVGNGSWTTPTSSAPANMLTTDTAQTTTAAGIKTFLTGTLLMRNAANTASHEPYSDANPPQTFQMTQFAAASVTNPPAGEATMYTSDSKSLSMRAPDGVVTIFPSGSGFSKITVGTATPTSPATGDLWVDTN